MIKVMNEFTKERECYRENVISYVDLPKKSAICYVDFLGENLTYPVIGA